MKDERDILTHVLSVNSKTVRAFCLDGDRNAVRCDIPVPLLINESFVVFVHRLDSRYCNLARNLLSFSE
jgi:hypothetical protein